MKNTFPKVIPQPLTRHRQRRDPTVTILHCDKTVHKMSIHFDNFMIKQFILCVSRVPRWTLMFPMDWSMNI